MYQSDFVQQTDVTSKCDIFSTWQTAVDVTLDFKLYDLITNLAPEAPWGERKSAAQKLGDMRSERAVPGLLDALPGDPFWMVRCAIIQALEKIGDQRAVPTLREVARNDGFQIVRSHAAKAVERLSQ